MSYIAYKNSGNIIQSSITWKLRKREQSFFLCATQRPDLIHIPIKLHKDILNGYCIMERTRMFGKINQMGITWNIRKGGQLFLCATYCRDLGHVLIKLHEDIPNGYWVMARVHMFRKNNQRGITCKLKKRGAIILVRDKSSWPNTYSCKIAWRYPKQVLNYGAYKNVDGRTVRKSNQMGITFTMRKGD